MYCLIASIALTLAVLFGCSSKATSNIYIGSMDLLDIFSSAQANAPISGIGNVTTNPDEQFFTYPLPARYLVGVSGKAF